jgi:hypothetical protein
LVKNIFVLTPKQSKNNPSLSRENCCFPFPTKFPLFIMPPKLGHGHRGDPPIKEKREKKKEEEKKFISHSEVIRQPTRRRRKNSSHDFGWFRGNTLDGFGLGQKTSLLLPFPPT